MSNFDLPGEATVYFCLVPVRKLNAVDEAVFKSEEMSFPSNRTNFTVTMDKVAGQTVSIGGYNLVIAVPNSNEKKILCNAQYSVDVSTKMRYKYRPDLTDSFSYGY